MLTRTRETNQRDQSDLGLRAGEPWNFAAADLWRFVLPAVGKSEVADIVFHGRRVCGIGSGFLGVGHGGGGDGLDGLSVLGDDDQVHAIVLFDYAHSKRR